MNKRLKLSVVADKLPKQGQAWLKGLNSTQRYGLEVILNNAGVNAFVKYWKKHRDELKSLEHQFGRF